jgi:hypothetical protein
MLFSPEVRERARARARAASCWTVGLGLGLSVLGAAGAEPWKVSEGGRTVTATTASLSATFRDGMLVSLESRTGGPSLFVSRPESSALPGIRDAKGFNFPDARTRASSRQDAAGTTMELRGLAGDPTGELDLRLEPGKDGDLILRQRARREAGGLLSATWGVAGIDAGRVQILVPGSGGVVVDGLRGPGALEFSWPGNWQAALVIVQGEGGGFCVWTDDPEALFKSADLRRIGAEWTISFGTESRAALAEAREVISPAWHIQAYRGDWKVPALAYRSAMAASRGLAPLGARRPAWIQDIRLVTRVSNDVTISHLESLAKEVDPRQTLLYVPGWRKLPYDVLYPDYKPREGFVEWCRAAQALGFRVMPHGNLLGIGPRSPELAKVETFIQRDRVSGERLGWYLDRPDDPCQIYCLDPASSDVRRFLIDHFRKAWEAVRFDALHLDFPVIASTRSGDIQGKSCARGAEVYLQELQAALPDVALGTEGLSEVLLSCSFAQLGEPFWLQPTPGVKLHPIRSFLFAPYCGLYGHLGMPSQATSFPAFLRHHDFFDHLGAWPTLSLDGPLDPASAGTRFVLEETRCFQGLRLTPAPEEVRWPTELFTWRGRSGALSAIFDDPPGRRLAPRDAPRAAAWLLVSRVNAFDGPGSISGWRAFEGSRLFGLDPDRRYPVVSGPPDARLLHLTSSSRPIILQEVRDGKRRSFFRLAGPASLIADLVEMASSAAAGIIVGGREEPLGSGGEFLAGEKTCGGRPLPGILAHPPWLGAALGGATYGEFSIQVPEAGRTVLRFAIGLDDLKDPADLARDRESPLSDGVTFSVRAGGKGLFREHKLRGDWTWREVDLSEFRGKAIILRFVTEPGPRGHPGWDWAVWGAPRIIRAAGLTGGEPLRVQVFSTRGDGTPFFGDPERQGKLIESRAAPGGALIDLELPGPQAFGFLHEVTPVSAGTDLSTVPFTVGSVSGELLEEGPVYGSGSVGRAGAAEGACTVISGHPPDFGRTVIDWCLELPQTRLRLEFQAQVLPRGGPVAFKVEVNGQEVWSLPMPSPDGWKRGAVDLSAWAGKRVLLGLVTDSLGSNNCDWAVWGDVRLAARP